MDLIAVFSTVGVPTGVMTFLLLKLDKTLAKMTEIQSELITELKLHRQKMER